VTCTQHGSSIQRRCRHLYIYYDRYGGRRRIDKQGTGEINSQSRQRNSRSTQGERQTTGRYSSKLYPTRDTARGNMATAEARRRKREVFVRKLMSCFLLAVMITSFFPFFNVTSGRDQFYDLLCHQVAWYHIPTRLSVSCTSHVNTHGRADQPTDASRSMI